jgi:alkylated DNA repair protein (DNA oxidative demethylase)
VLADLPLMQPTMPRIGKAFSVRMTNCGPLGWVSDRDGGYRYQSTHPRTGQPRPKIPELLSEVWEAVAGYRALPEACLVNLLGAGCQAVSTPAPQACRTTAARFGPTLRRVTRPGASLDRTT